MCLLRLTQYLSSSLLTLHNLVEFVYSITVFFKDYRLLQGKGIQYKVKKKKDMGMLMLWTLDYFLQSLWERRNRREWIQTHNQNIIIDDKKTITWNLRRIKTDELKDA